MATVGRVLREEIAAGRIEEVRRDGRRKVYKKTEEGQRYYALMAFEQRQKDLRENKFRKNDIGRKKTKLARKARRTNR